ncbi:MAG: hypothetical protein K2K48_05615 [Anaeroplasmataceae bacterium]|nr:hypothetical protein [Anaeroplasmataceae bacterium]MDE6414872.1 hypothetical protein [Anaeroplasmataceae bacterium]
MKKEFISKYDIIHHNFDIENPLTIGNGNFAFTCDITGLQTFYQSYTKIPLCTMSNLFWGKQKGTGDLPYQVYIKKSDASEVKYMTDTTAEAYENYRDDVFKFDMFKLVFLVQGKPMKKEKIKVIYQKLILYEGKIETEFQYEKETVYVEAKIPQKHNHLQIKIKTELKQLQIKILFLVPASTLHGSSLEELQTYKVKDSLICIQNSYLDYTIFYKTNMKRENAIFKVEKDSFLSISLDNDFNNDCGMEEYFSLAKSLNTKDEELNRRMVLSLYLLKVNTLGIYPPAETGLTCNSWYGKFHLEMHLWHHLGLIRFGLYSYVLPSLKWYLSIYESSKKRAEEQGYQGIRFPKMTDYRGEDTPSTIGCLLIWQMPHLFIMLDEIIKQDANAIKLEDWLPTLMGLLDFMVSFYYLKDGRYHLDSPMIPANENIKYDCDTPIFEECYTIYAFEIFKRWKEEYHLLYDTTQIDAIIKHHVPLEVHNGCYEAFIGCNTTYTEYNYDHPMMVGMFSYFQSSIADPTIVQNTLHKIIECWNFDAAWGWDFPMLSMVANRLGKKELAIQLLKMDALKNTYLKNGHNPQLPRKDLPLYLPGNGALLLALTYLFK